MIRRFHAPGRVNLIGEHTDYCGGLALPCAIDRGVTTEVTGPSRTIALASSARGAPAIELQPDGSDAPGGWGRYVAAVAAELADLGRPSVGLTGRVVSDLPIGAGLSSSAALAVSVALSLCAVAGFPLTDLELVRACQRAERRAVGVPTGPLDQSASILGRAGSLIRLDCTSLEHELVPFPPQLALIVIDSGAPRTLERSAYATRRTELEHGLAARAALGPDPVGAPAEPPPLPASLEEASHKRVRHFLSENRRVDDLIAALRNPTGIDRDAVAALLYQGHESLRSDFEVSTPELDLLVALARTHGAAGARMTGAGFGGSVLILAEHARAASIAQAIIRDYRQAKPDLKARTLECAPSDGAREIA